MKKIYKHSKISAEEDLAWFFWESEAAMGAHSNYGNLFEHMRYATGRNNEFNASAFAEAMSRPTEIYDLIQATGRARRILKNYQKLSTRHKVILEKYFEERQYNSEMAAGFGPGIGLVPMTMLGREMEKLTLQYPPAKLIRHFQSIKKPLKRQVQEIYQEAVACYVQIALLTAKVANE